SYGNIRRMENLIIRIGRGYSQDGDYYSAADELKKGLKVIPESVRLLYELADCYMKLEKYDKAMSAFKKVIKISPVSRQALDSIERMEEIKNQGGQ
ncbi:MAG: tetratricopeptide repeat protein, partial [Elusimicrobia bacterium]|nr:tetratricopeptide repeat protein [Elusimicrobiota bacterium]